MLFPLSDPSAIGFGLMIGFLGASLWLSREWKGQSPVSARNFAIGYGVLLVVYAASRLYGNVTGVEQYVAQMGPQDATPWICIPLLLSAFGFGIAGYITHADLKDGMRISEKQHFRAAVRVGSVSFVLCWFASLLNDITFSTHTYAAKSTLYSVVNFCAIGGLLMAFAFAWMADRAEQKHYKALKRSTEEV